MENRKSDDTSQIRVCILACLPLLWEDRPRVRSLSSFIVKMVAFSETE